MRYHGLLYTLPYMLLLWKFCTTFINYYFQHFIRSVTECPPILFNKMSNKLLRVTIIFLKKDTNIILSFLKTLLVTRGNALKLIQTNIYFTENLW